MLGFMARRHRRQRHPARRAGERDVIPPGFHERLVVGYHGCERATARRVLLGQEPLRASSNDYDWLGGGIYFWEHGLIRAQQFAEEKLARGVLDDPVVIGAYLQLGRCLDLTDVWATRLLRSVHTDLQRELDALGIPLPTNSPPTRAGGDRRFRRLDCAVIDLCVTGERGAASPSGPHLAFDTVRGAFEEGLPAFFGAAVREKSHVQIAVRNPACILGIFRPAGYTF